MKNIRIFSIVVLVAFSVFTSGCASLGMVGSLYTDVTMPVTATSNSVGTKAGEAKATAILALICTGDAGINAAAKDGGISKISHVDYKIYSILGIFTTMTTTVYGE